MTRPTLSFFLRIFSYMYIIGLFSCSKELKYDIEHTPKLVVNATLDDAGISVKVSKSVKVIGQLPDLASLLIKNATVQLIVEDTTYNISNLGNGTYYQSINNILKIGTNYTLKVSAPNHDDVSSNITYKGLSSIEALSIKKGGVIRSPSDDQRLQTYDLLLPNSQDPDQYIIRVMNVPSSGESFTYNSFGFTKYFDNANYPCNYNTIDVYSPIGPKFILTDQCSLKDPIQESIFFAESEDGTDTDPLIVSFTVLSVDKDYLSYFQASTRSVYNVDASNFPDKTESNIENGFGYFTITKTKIIIF